MVKKTATGGVRNIFVFFVEKYRSKLFELCFMTKKQKEGGMGLLFGYITWPSHKRQPNLAQRCVQYPPKTSSIDLSCYEQDPPLCATHSGGS